MGGGGGEIGRRARGGEGEGWRGGVGRVVVVGVERSSLRPLIISMPIKLIVPIPKIARNPFMQNMTKTSH